MIAEDLFFEAEIQPVGAVRGARNFVDAGMVSRLGQKYRYEALHCLILGEVHGQLVIHGGWATDFLLELRGRVQKMVTEMRLSRPLIAALVEEYRQRHDRDFCAPERGVADDPCGLDDMRLWNYLLERLGRPGDPVDVGAYLEICRSRAVERSKQSPRDLGPGGHALRHAVGGANGPL